MKQYSKHNRHQSVQLFGLKNCLLGAIQKGYSIFWVYFGPTYLPISHYIRFLKTYLPTQRWDILCGRPLMAQTTVNGLAVSAG